MLILRTSDLAIVRFSKGDWCNFCHRKMQLTIQVDGNNICICEDCSKEVTALFETNRDYAEQVEQEPEPGECCKPPEPFDEVPF